jgi:CheY-like chemotaxis protein
LRHIKQDPDLRSIPVVVLTTSSATSDKARAYQNYANSFLTKPLDFDDFHQMVRDLKLYWTVWNQPVAPRSN